MFPTLSRKVYGKNLVYFDNAATSQRPQIVIDEWNRITAESNANIHRAVHRLADEATQAYEQARDAVKDFLNSVKSCCNLCRVMSVIIINARSVNKAL